MAGVQVPVVEFLPLSQSPHKSNNFLFHKHKHFCSSFIKLKHNVLKISPAVHNKLNLEKQENTNMNLNIG